MTILAQCRAAYDRKGLFICQSPVLGFGKLTNRGIMKKPAEPTRTSIQPSDLKLSDAGDKCATCKYLTDRDALGL